jgi:hypothetical protein
LQFMYYPFLFEPKVRPGLPCRIKRKLASVFKMNSLTDMRRASLTAAFWNSYFFHLGGGSLKDAALVDTNGRHVWYSSAEARAVSAPIFPNPNAKEDL